MVQYNNNRGGGRCLEKFKILVFLGKHVSFILYIFVNCDVTDTFTLELLFC